jgi:hypothetical protein
VLKGVAAAQVQLSWHRAGAPKALYGFEPTELVGQPLAAVVDVFGRWRHQFGEDDSLLALLAAQAMDDAADAGINAGKAGCASWRVGVHLPVKGDTEIAEHAASLAADSHLNKQVCVCLYVRLCMCIYMRFYPWRPVSVGACTHLACLPLTSAQNIT